MHSLPPWTRNAGKRLVKPPKVYWRDSGIFHTLAGLPTLENLLGHPLCGASWEGYCLEQILSSERGVVVIPKGETYPLSKTVTASGLQSFLVGMPESFG